MSAPREEWYECYGGPRDGDGTWRMGREWWFRVPGVASGHYQLATLSDARGRDMGTHWLWRAPTPEPRP